MITIIFLTTASLIVGALFGYLWGHSKATDKAIEFLEKQPKGGGGEH